jgi:hypothetical protein
VRREHLSWKILAGAALGIVGILDVAAQEAAQPSLEQPVPAQASSGRPPDATQLPEIAATARKRAAARPVRPQRQPAATSSAAPASGAATGPAVEGIGASSPPLSEVATLGKTGTKLEDLPVSVVVVPATTIKERGGTSLTEGVLAPSPPQACPYALPQTLHKWPFSARPGTNASYDAVHAGCMQATGEENLWRARG